VRSHLMTLKTSRHPKRKNPRIAVVVSKKTYKGAVGRNRIRRRLYEIMRHELPSIEYNRDIVLIVFSAEVLSVPHEELVQLVRQLLESADVYKKEPS